MDDIKRWITTTNSVRKSSERSLAEEEAKQFLEDLFEILIYLQERSPPVIHRDIKPSNIMRHKSGELALIDFGAVQSVIPKEGGGSTIIGTSGYMPVEQLMGRAEPATDLYAVGTTVIHLLSRRHPADLPMEEMRLQFQSAVNISDAFTTYLEKLTDPHVEARFSTAKEALRELRRLDEPKKSPPKQSPPRDRSPPRPQPSKASSPAPSSKTSSSDDDELDDDWMYYKPDRWWNDKRKREEAFFAVAFLAVLFAGFGALFAIPYWTTSATNRPASEHCQENSLAHSCVQWGQELEDSDPSMAQRAYARGCELGDSGGCLNQGMMALRRGNNDDAIRLLHRACRMDEVDACNNLVAILDDDDSKAVEAAEKACELESHLGCANYASVFLRRFEDAMEEEDEDEARRQVRQAWRYADRGCQEDSESGCYRLALAELYQGNPGDAQRAAQRALGLNDRHPHPHMVLGLTLAIDGDVDDAIESLESALTAAQNPGGDEQPLFDDPRAETTSNILRHLAVLERVYPERTEFLGEVHSHFAQ